MPQSKNRKNHKTKVNQFKQNQKNMDEQTQKAMNQQIPPVRSVPVWENDAQIVISGLEWEALYNPIMQLQLAQQAANAVMSRNIVSGVIGMDFEKLSDDKQSYVPMTEEEKAPHRESFATMLKAAQRQQAGVSETPAVTAEPAKVAKPKTKRATKAKVVKGGFGAKTVGTDSTPNETPQA